MMMKRFSSISFAVLAATPVHAMDLRTMARVLQDDEERIDGSRVGSAPNTAETKPGEVDSSSGDGIARLHDSTLTFNVGVAPALTVYPDYLHSMWRMAGRIDVLEEDLNDTLIDWAFLADQVQAKMQGLGADAAEQMPWGNAMKAKFPSRQTSSVLMDLNAPVPSPQYLELRMQKCFLIVVEILQFMNMLCPAFLIDERRKILEEAENANMNVSNFPTMEKVYKLRQKFMALLYVMKMSQNALHVLENMETAPEISSDDAASVSVRVQKFKTVVEAHHVGLSVEHVKTLPQAMQILDAARDFEIDCGRAAGETSYSRLVERSSAGDSPFGGMFMHPRVSKYAAEIFQSQPRRRLAPMTRTIGSNSAAAEPAQRVTEVASATTPASQRTVTPASTSESQGTASSEPRIN